MAPPPVDDCGFHDRAAGGDRHRGVRVQGEAEADPIDAAVPAIMEAEGFRGEPYDDTTGNPTIGYGTKLPLTEAEGELLLRHRLAAELKCIADGWQGGRTPTCPRGSRWRTLSMLWGVRTCWASTTRWRPSHGATRTLRQRSSARLSGTARNRGAWSR